MIELSGVSKSFLTDELETRALDDIHLSILKGEFVSINGPSGCGKSTLLGILGLLDVATQGAYYLNERDVLKLSNRERAHVRNREIGFVFQAFNLISDLNVEENVGVPLLYRDDLSRKECKAMVAEALAKVDMSHRARHFPSQLSGGQQQRVAVARAIVNKPGLILADEPTGNLDSRNAELVMNLLRQIHADGATLCMVTHDPRSAALAKRRVSLFDGRLVDDQVGESGIAPAHSLILGV
ncbi:ABC transporter ATP-binding protein [Burkholderiaceae bacterium DAT-1]|nr:ABC transporter ATP-binding protein [Burkholderiaceae bacterium DAT-1]